MTVIQRMTKDTKAKHEQLNRSVYIFDIQKEKFTIKVTKNRIEVDGYMIVQHLEDIHFHGNHESIKYLFGTRTMIPCNKIM